MAAFEKIKSGLKGVDDTLQNIRLGDNVIWQISNLKEYTFFVKAFVKQAIEDKKNIIYIRFAEHEALLENQEGLKIEKLDVNSGFEKFTIDVHKIIKREGDGAFYVFDCLSELQTVWAADLTMGNFFVVTCPYLFVLNTVAYFALIRNKHSYNTIARIRETTQLFIDVIANDTNIFVHPLKVWNRYSQTMFLPHIFENKDGADLVPLTDGISVSKFFSIISGFDVGQSIKVMDNWDKFFIFVKMNIENGITVNSEIKDKICRMLIGTDKKLLELSNKYFNVSDLLQIKERSIGSGLIGGKTVGMLLSRKIIEVENPKLYSCIEPHDSFYIATDIFYTYLVQNGWWRLFIDQKNYDDYYLIGKILNEKMLDGVFPEFIKEQFRRMLEYYGQVPIIVRSSSLLEDGFGNAFAGKYESIFCVNTGPIEERLKEFENAIKTVYASSMNESALVYRRKRKLDKSDEQMAILVQRVSGSMYDDIFMPCAAGVGYSYNSYAWTSEIDSSAGLIRIVLGLGTRAVDRTDGDYSRLASLDKPHLNPVKSIGERYKFSQRYIDVLDFTIKKLTKIDIESLSRKTPKWFGNIMYEHDYEVEAMLRERSQDREVILTTCDNLLKRDEIVNTLRSILHTLQSVYNYPVDIEFTINISEKDDYMINLLQCRPLQVKGSGKKVIIPTIKNENVFFSIERNSMGGPADISVDYLILVESEGYYLADWSTKYSIARIIGQINNYFKDKEKVVMLIGPGRWGTSSPELGVPVSFAEISNIKILCEVSYENGRLMPELSFGSHFFQDLVEGDIFYAAIFENREQCIYNPEILTGFNNIFNNIITNNDKFKDIIKVYDVKGLNLLSDDEHKRTVSFLS